MRIGAERTRTGQSSSAALRGADLPDGAALFAVAGQPASSATCPTRTCIIWTLAWDAHAFLHQPLHIFDANIYYPYANTLAYSENLIGSAFFAAPIIWLTGNIVLAMNLTALLTCVLCGTRRLSCWRAGCTSAWRGAFICGLIFAFAPPRFVRMGQLHMTAVQWIPFSLAFLHTYFERGRRRDLLLAIGVLLAAGAGQRPRRRVSAARRRWR